jgi:hypothetical protein
MAIESVGGVPLLIVVVEAVCYETVVILEDATKD